MGQPSRTPPSLIRDADIARIFGAATPLGAALPGFVPRAAQSALAKAVADVIRVGGALLAEAGTGTGKTFAYLVPVLLSGQKAIVSTATKALQDQLYQRDLPALRAGLGNPARIALLKGRSNYLCPYRLARHASSLHDGGSRLLTDFLRVSRWARTTRDGDMNGLADLAEDSPVRPWVTSTADNCLGQDCPELRQCFVAKARQAAQEADIVVVNHHLLCADLALADHGFGALLPKADIYIIDEAHQLVDTAAPFFGLRVSSRQIVELARDSVSEHQAAAGTQPALVEAAYALEQQVLAMRDCLGHETRRAPLIELQRDPSVMTAFQSLHTALETLQLALTQVQVTSVGLAACKQRADELLRGYGALLAPSPTDSEHAYWYETFARSFSLQATPLHAGGRLVDHINARGTAWIFTSATLTVGKTFTHFQQRLPLPRVTTARWESPFDYAAQTVLYVPTHLPEPASTAYTRALITAVIPVLRASGGRAFMLFTSLRAIKEAAPYLRAELPEYPLFVQGEASKTSLLQRFRVAGNGVLLGSSSFWEGVDVSGPALSCVVIDKLPFAAPSDPLLQARISHAKQHGLDAFDTLQLPEAVIALKQGLGRLIRREADRGVMMVCDSRLLTRGYGKTFLESLPPLRITRVLADVERFYAAEKAALRTP